MEGQGYITSPKNDYTSAESLKSFVFVGRASVGSTMAALTDRVRDSGTARSRRQLRRVCSEVDTVHCVQSVLCSYVGWLHQSPNRNHLVQSQASLRADNIPRLGLIVLSLSTVA